MNQRVKYPLTSEAKEEARRLVEAWETGEVRQALELLDVTAGGDATDVQLMAALGANSSFQCPSLGIIRELAEYKLISLVHILSDRSDRFEITLLQELRNAVEHDFEVSDFFLTTSAIGTIIHGDLVLEKGALFQSAAAGVGDVNVTADALPDELVKLLGADATRPNIEQAIAALRTADEPTRREKAGRVIAELGRSLEHLSNAGGAISAIVLITRLLSTGTI